MTLNGLILHAFGQEFCQVFCGNNFWIRSWDYACKMCHISNDLVFFTTMACYSEDILISDILATQKLLEHQTLVTKLLRSK